MAKKVHVTRFDENIEERAIQMRNGDPISPVETQFWFDKDSGQLSYFLDGEKHSLNVRVLSGDPVSPLEKEIWINGATDELKYKYDGIVRTINLGNVNLVEGGGQTSDYLRVLDEAELRRIADVSASYPDYLIESLNEVKDTVTLTNTEVQQSRLALAPGQTTGTYERETRKTRVLNTVEGVAVITSQGLAPKTITDNLDGTHTIVFRGDVSDIVYQGQNLVLMETDTVEGVEQDFPLLNTNGKPALLDISTLPSYSSGTNETTITVNDYDLDLTMGLATSAEQEAALKFAPMGISIEAGADGLAGTLGELEILEMHSDEAERIVGQELYRKLPTFYKGSTNSIMVKHSPNKRYWAIITKEEAYTPGDANLSNVARLYYSTDALKTIHMHPTWEDGFSDPTTNDTGISADFNDRNYKDYSGMHPRNIILTDTGKLMFCKGKYNWNTYWSQRGWYCDISKPDFVPTEIPNMGGYNGEPNASTSQHLYGTMVNWLESESIFSVGTVYNDHEVRDHFYKLDFDNPSLSIPLGYTATLTDYSTNHEPFYCGFHWIEEEWQYFRISHHINDYMYAYRIYLSDILEGDANGNYPRTGIPWRNGFANAPEAGTRHNTNSLWHFTTTMDGAMINYHFNEDDNELICIMNDNDAQMHLGTINFDRTSKGVLHVETLSTDQVPINGSVTLDIIDGQDLSVQTSPTLSYNDDATDIQTKLATMTSTFGAGNVEVTGDWTTGFQITDRSDLTTGTGANPKPLTYTVNTNTLRYAGGAPFLGDAYNGTSTLTYNLDNVAFREKSRCNSGIYGSSFSFRGWCKPRRLSGCQ